jgi:type II secretory ATPase GspE/PulE/Tfp pilus assembly ATPase PilB-like protein
MPVIHASVNLKGKNLAEIFELGGFLTKDQTDQLTSEARASGQRIAEAALEFGFISEERLVQALSLQSGFPAMTPEALDELLARDRLFEHRDIFFRYTALPLSDGRIALHDAQAIPQLARDLSIGSFSTSKWCLAPRTYLLFRLTDLLGLSQVDRLGALKDSFSQTPSPPPTRLLEILLETAWGLKASDIHIEPFDRFTRIRARVEGHLRFWASVPREQFEPVGNLIRTQSGLTNRSMMKSHDGEFTFLSGRTEIPVRLSLIPTIYRQFSMVLRLLGSGPGASIIPEILGYSEKTLARIRTIVDQSSGITFFTGPTGSGKNTSLHAIFRRILETHPGKAFVEVADPIEYRLGQGVQAQVWRSETDSWSYSAALKSTLRHDPDIIMVGETRDPETASIAFDAALTGHLVLSTLHVTEAAGVFDRMARLSVPPADLLSALRVVVNQRLVGRLCPSCKVDVPIPDIPWLSDMAKARGIGSFKDGGNPSCPVCGGLGMLGRYAIAETMAISHEVRRTLSKTGAYGAVAFLETYREIDPEFETLAEMLIDDAASGKTGLSEVLRIVGTVL